MPRTDYDPITDTLSCGCDPNWADHRCLGGFRPSYCCCGAPDDCYCPSPSERAAECDLTEKVFELRIYANDRTKAELELLLRDQYDWALIDLTEVDDDDTEGN